MSDDILGDLGDEQTDLAAVLRSLPEEAWDLPTRAAGWRVRDQVGHLAFYEEQSVLAATEPDTFTRRTQELLEDLDRFFAVAEALGRDLTGSALLERWERAAAETAPVLRSLPEGARLPWYGPPMSVRSFVTARLMETWAHGTDVVDALTDAGLPAERPGSDRLRHICHLGVITRGWSYAVRGAEQPDEPVFVSLRLPSGLVWTSGEPSASSSIVGTAEDFCLVVTQRRNVLDTGLSVQGEGASSWMDVAQCFAGAPTLPPAAGRHR